MQFIVSLKIAQGYKKVHCFEGLIFSRYPKNFTKKLLVLHKSLMWAISIVLVEDNFFAIDENWPLLEPSLPLGGQTVWNKDPMQ